jgi:hypothetical protein
LSDQDVPASTTFLLQLPESVASDLSKADKADEEEDEVLPEEEGAIRVGKTTISLKKIAQNLSVGKEDGLYGQNVNIYEEPDGPKYMITEPAPDGTGGIIVHAGTINKLVEYLTAADNTDVRFMHAFLMTYLSFTNPKTLMNKLMERYNAPTSSLTPAEIRRIQLRVCNVLKQWVTHYFDDFDQELIKALITFIDETLLKDGHESIVAVLRNSIVNQSRGTRSRAPTSWSSREQPPPPKLELKGTDKTLRKAKLRAGPENSVLPDSGVSLFDYDEEEVARQLTIREFELYSQIKVPELLDQSWNREKLHHRAPNVLKMIARFNESSLYVASMILEPIKVKERVNRWCYLIKVAEHLYQLNNFNLLMAFIGGMNNSCILRLKWTKALLPKKSAETLEKLEKIMSSDGSYKNYREMLSSVSPPCLPYIGVHLSDLIFIEDGNPDEVSGLINWDKRSLVHRVIDLLGQYQNNKYNLTPVPSIAAFFETMSPPSEKELYDVSLSREPRGAQKHQIL